MFSNCINTITKGILRLCSRCYSTKISQGGPLTGFRVLDLTRIVAGPYCTMLLGDLGADVIKVERLKTGDESRRWGPPFMNNSNDSCYFMASNRNKRSVSINLKSAAGKKVIFDLAKKSDVLVENYVPGKLVSMGLGYDDLKKANSGLIYCSITGYGSKGPYANRPGYDVIAASLGGLLHMTGPKDGEPCKVGVAMTDIATGLYAHGAILAALLARSVTKVGQKVECNLLSTQVSTLINVGSNYLNAGQEAKRWGTAHESIVPYQSFPTKSGYLTIGAGSDDQFKMLCKKLSIDSVATDPKYITNVARVTNRESLIKMLTDIFITRSTQDWLNILEGAAFPYAPINNLEEVFSDEHIKAIGIVKEISHHVYGSVKTVGHPVEYSASKISVHRAPPTLGEHTDEVLKEVLDYKQEEIDELRLNNDVPILRLRLTKPKHRKSVQWTETTIDNEHMNKKKSKCCCIYEKARSFEELMADEEEEEHSDEDHEECENCHGHVERRKKTTQPSEEDTGEGTSKQDEGEDAESETVQLPPTIEHNNSDEKLNNTN